MPFKKGHTINVGRPLSEEHKAKIGDASRGRTLSEESKKKISEARKGTTASEETKQKMSQARTGMRRSEETKNRMSEARMGIPPWNKGLRGPETSNWKGGSTPEAEKIRQSPEMATWRKFVFERDDYTCQECLVRGGELRAHHCKSFAEYPRLRFQTWNGITLCKKCHRDYHGGIG